MTKTTSVDAGETRYRPTLPWNSNWLRPHLSLGPSRQVCRLLQFRLDFNDDDDGDGGNDDDDDDHDDDNDNYNDKKNNNNKSNNGDDDDDDDDDDSNNSDDDDDNGDDDDDDDNDDHDDDDNCDNGDDDDVQDDDDDEDDDDNGDSDIHYVTKTTETDWYWQRCSNKSGFSRDMRAARERASDVKGREFSELLSIVCEGLIVVIFRQLAAFTHKRQKTKQEEREGGVRGRKKK